MGSNIANVLLVLGAAAAVVPLLARRRLVRVDAPVLLGLGVLALVLALDGRISPVDGSLLLAVFVVHMVASVWIARGDEAQGVAASEQVVDATSRGWVALLLVVAGVALLVLGAEVLVAGATSVAEMLGVSGLVVGLTVVAIGTSLPELAASAIAALRGEQEMAVGNVIGNCIANIGLVLGAPALLGDGLPVPAPALALDLPVMIAALVALVPVSFTGYVIARWEGGMFLVLYVACIAFLVLDATRHEALEGFTTVMVLFVLPLVVLALATTVAYELGRISERRRRAAANG